MANTIQIFDPITQASKAINLTIDSALIVEAPGEEDVVYDFFVKASTSAKRGVTGADEIPDQIIRGLNDLCLDSTQFDGVTGTDYADLNAAIEDYVMLMKNGASAGEAMYFG